MARSKVPMRLVDNARRATTHARRAKGLQKKALELATFCGVPVGLVCSGAGAGAPPLEWESEEGVLERYRRAVPPEARAGHTHRAYLETELAKRRAKLARARHGCPAALADWDEALNDMTLDGARELLEFIDAALRAAGDRMEALGLPADRGHGDGPLGEQVAPDSPGDDVMPQRLGHGGGVTWTEGYAVGMADAAGFQQLQMVPYHGGNNDGLLERFPWEHGFQMQPGCGGFQCASGNYSGGGDDGMLALGLANAGYNNSSGGGDGVLALGLANAGYNYSGGGDEMLALGLANAGYNNSGGGDGMLAPGLGNAGYNYSVGGGPAATRCSRWAWAALTTSGLILPCGTPTRCATQPCHLGTTLTSPTALWCLSTTPPRSPPAATTSTHYHLGTATPWAWAWATTSPIWRATTRRRIGRPRRSSAPTPAPASCIIASLSLLDFRSQQS